ncbi:MAG: protein kinase [Gammaproteobacteria bacterium]|nr:protein kinase [Gammaproteobacteria bacterium]
MAKKAIPKIKNFDFHPGRQLSGKYEVVELLGKGWEGEVYRVRELATGIDRAAKFFYPHRNVRDSVITYYAKKLNKLRQCSILIPYLTHDQIRHRNQIIKFLVSEFVEGLLLKEFILRQPGKRLTPFEGLHLLHSLALGLEEVHAMRDYHGDLHAENIIINRKGIGFDVKMIDIYRWQGRSSENIRGDMFDIIRVFYDAIGGKKHYAKQRQEIKNICCGLKRSLIEKKFRSAGQLRLYLEKFDWDTH